MYVDFFVANINWYYAEVTFASSVGMILFGLERYVGEWRKEIKNDCIGFLW